MMILTTANRRSRSTPSRQRVDHILSFSKSSKKPQWMAMTIIVITMTNSRSSNFRCIQAIIWRSQPKFTSSTHSTVGIRAHLRLTFCRCGDRTTSLLMVMLVTDQPGITRRRVTLALPLCTQMPMLFRLCTRSMTRCLETSRQLLKIHQWCRIRTCRN